MNAPGLAVERATWLPARSELVDGWLLGFTAGLTRRANSAAPAEPGAPLSAEVVSRVEARYAAAGLPPVFRLCAAAPEGAESVLAGRGYTRRVTTDVLVRALPGPEESEALTAPGAMDVADTPDRAWLDTWLGSKAATADTDLAAALLTRSPARYLTARDAEQVVLGVIRVGWADSWAGLSCLAVTPAARRRGVGRRLTLAGMAEAARRDATGVFLQVEVQNAPAAALYAGLGFEAAERYAYWER